MTTADERNRPAVRPDDDALLAGLNEPGVVARVLTTLRLAPRWTTVFVLLWNLAFTACAVWFAIAFFQTTETQHMIAWATGFLGALMMVMALKIWFWMQMEKYVVLRELKRLEAQVARLVGRQTSDS